MFFETSGWALPKNIATEKKEVVSKKDKLAQSKLPNSKEGKASREADQIQAQMATLNDQSTVVSMAEAPKAKKPRVRNKKRALEEEPVEEKFVEEKPVEVTKKAKKNKPVEKQQPEPVGTKKNQQKKKLQQVNILD